MISLRRLIKKSIKSCEIGLKEKIVRLGTLFFDRPQSATEPLNPQNIKRILFLRYDKLGDLAVSLPVFATLKKRLPHIELDLLASPRNISLLRSGEIFRRVFLYRKHFFTDLLTIREIRRQNYDLIVDMICRDSVTSLYLTQLIGGCRVGLGKITQAEFYHYHIPVDISLEEHMLTVTLRTLSPLGLSEAEYLTEAPLHLSEKESQELGQALDTCEVSVKEAPLGINVSAGAPNRHWGESNYRELIQALMAEGPQRKIIVLCAPADRQMASRITAGLPEGVRLIPAGLSIRLVAGLIGRLALLITPDTSLTHVARNLKIPVVGLYSRHQRNTSQWRPYGQKRGLVQGKAIDDIHDIRPAQVLQEVNYMLQESSDVSA